MSSILRPRSRHVHFVTNVVPLCPDPGITSVSTVTNLLAPGVRNMSGSEKTLWKLAIEERNRMQTERGGDEVNESSAIFVGNKNAGKTTIMLRFQEREEPPKPTVALEYTFGRRQARGPNMGKKVVHIWELGGGTSLTKLLDSPINEKSIK